jgi:ligand-binding sensor domain-containing protein
MKTIIFKHVKHVILCVCILTSSITAFSQSGEWQQYDGEKAIFRLLKDGKNLWIATNSGLSQLNTETGTLTTHDLGISDLPLLRNLAKDNDGSLWVTTQRNGVIKYDVQSGRLESYNQSNSDLANNQYCTSIAIDADNNKWIGSLMYLNRFDGNEWQSWTTPGSAVAAYWFISDLQFDRNGDLWMAGASPEWHFAKFAGDAIQPVPEVTQGVNKILIDEDNSIWLASESQGLIKYDGTQFVTWNTGNSNLPSNNIYDIKQDASGNLWLACYQHLVRFDGNEFISYTSPLIQENNDLDFISCLELDDDGTIWLGAKVSGLFKFTQAQGHLQPVSYTVTAIPAVSGKNANGELLVRSVNSELSVGLFLPDNTAKVSLMVSDLQGREVVSLLKGQYLSKGNHRYSASLPKGVYVVGYTANGRIVAEKVLVR